MNRNKSASIFHVLLKRLLHRLGPLLTVVVADDNVIIGKHRSKRVPFGFKLFADFFCGFCCLKLLVFA